MIRAVVRTRYGTEVAPGVFKMRSECVPALTAAKVATQHRLCAPVDIPTGQAAFPENGQFRLTRPHLVEPKARIGSGRKFRGPASASKPLYRMQDLDPEAPLWNVICVATGVTLGRVRGTALWALKQAQRLAESQGGGIGDVRCVAS